MKKLALCLAIVLAMVSGFALAEEVEISVVGKATVLVESDLAAINLGVHYTADDAIAAQQMVNERVNAVTEALINAGVDKNDIRTENINIYTNTDYDYDTDEEYIISYTAYTGMSVVSTDVVNIGSLVDVALGAGINQFNGIDFFVQDETAANDAALTAAVQDAERRANVIAAAAGLSVVELEEIAEEGGYSYYSGSQYKNNAADMTMESAADAATHVNAAKVSVEASVRVVYKAK